MKGKEVGSGSLTYVNQAKMHTGIQTTTILSFHNIEKMLLMNSFDVIQLIFRFAFYNLLFLLFAFQTYLV